MENELVTGTDEGGRQGGHPAGVQTAGHATPSRTLPLPPFRKEPPPSRNTSRLGGGSCAQAQGKAKSGSKIKGGIIRTLRIPRLQRGAACLHGSALCQPQPVIPGLLHQPLPQAGHTPKFDALGMLRPSPQVAQVIGDRAEPQAHFGESREAGWHPARRNASSSRQGGSPTPPVCLP